MPDKEKSRGTILVVDDEESTRQYLRIMLESLGFKIVQATNGIEAIACYKEYSPKIIFMDIIMPEMDGYEATRRIKAIDKDKYIPIVFLTSLDDDESLIKCLDVGGDEFLSKPFKTSILTAKLVAIERTLVLHEKTTALLNHIIRDEEVANDVYQCAVLSGNVATEQINLISRPHSTFSGDIMLSEHSNNGDLYVLLGDFTGHGLGAAMGALPTTELFRNLASKGLPVQTIVEELNKKLFANLPINMFMCAQLIVIHHDMRRISAISCGMPDIIVVSGNPINIKHRVTASGPPLGAIEIFDFENTVSDLSISTGDHVLLTTDGLTESTNPENEMYGEQKYTQSVLAATTLESLLSDVMKTLDSYISDQVQSDDITVIDIPVTPAILPKLAEVSTSLHEVLPSNESNEKNSKFAISFRMDLRGNALKFADPVSQIIECIKPVVILGEQENRLHTILTELYLNALEHGVLELDSECKNNPQGFCAYMDEKEKRLENLLGSFVFVEVILYCYEAFNMTKVVFKDSGQGFDYQSQSNLAVGTESLYGRGINMVKNLCHEVTYMGNGNHVEVWYRWDNP